LESRKDRKNLTPYLALKLVGKLHHGKKEKEGYFWQAI
jgi:hypothetical protein